MSLVFNVPLAGSSASTSSTPLTVMYAFGTVAASQTDATLTRQDTGGSLAATTNSVIRVLGCMVIADTTASTLKFNTKGSGAGTAITPNFPISANGGFCIPPTPMGLIGKTNTGENLTVTTGGATVYIIIAYVVEPA